MGSSVERPPVPSAPHDGTGSGSARDDFFFSAIAATRMPMVVTDPHAPDGPIVFVNDAFAQMSGYATGEILGRNCRFLQGPATDRLSVAAIRDAIAAREEITIEILNYRKDGSTFWNALFVSPVFDEGGALVYFFASQLDVSRRRAAEEALGQSQKMEALGQLTGGISHDFNNLLQVMLGQVDLLDRRLRADTVDLRAVGMASQGVRSAIGKAATLTQQLLAFARKQRLDHRLINLNRLTGNLADLAGGTLGDAIEVIIRPAADLHDCRIDPIQFEVALLNILINARDAMQGRGTVTIRTSNVTIEAGPRTIGELEAGRYACIAVSDSGPGIPSEILPRVMEPFFTTKEEGKGTGLGLSMVYGFARQSGGAARIDSEPGTGTTIRLYFPVAVDGDRDPVDAVARSRERGGGERILLVDDRPEVLAVARNLLEELGYRVLSAHSGAEAIGLFEALVPGERPSLLFSDVIMPGGMNGYVLARKLRERLPTMKVLLTSGYAGDAQGNGGEGRAEFEVMKKPYGLDEMARRIRLILDQPAPV